MKITSKESRLWWVAYIYVVSYDCTGPAGTSEQLKVRYPTQQLFFQDQKKKKKSSNNWALRQKAFLWGIL